MLKILLQSWADEVWKAHLILRGEPGLFWSFLHLDQKPCWFLQNCVHVLVTKYMFVILCSFNRLEEGENIFLLVLQLRLSLAWESI